MFMSEQCLYLTEEQASNELKMTKNSLRILVRLFLLPSIPPYQGVQNEKENIEFQFCSTDVEKFKD